VRQLSYGDSGLLVELDDLGQVLALNRALAGQRPVGIVDVVPAARTVLVTFDREVTSAEAVSQWLGEQRDGPTTAVTNVTEAVIPVSYDGADLTEVARLCGMSTSDVVALHSGATYTVAFCGFAPGFAYLTGVPADLRVRRRSTPRTSVPAGAVALADEFTGVYPRASPGGWQLIGNTDLTVFDLNRDPPALLAPGTVVRFEPQVRKP
jgi:KipI family sensor histidine kinase inhibitor